MRSEDIAYVYSVVGWGAEVLILDVPIDRAVRYAQFRRARCESFKRALA